MTGLVMNHSAGPNLLVLRILRRENDVIDFAWSPLTQHGVAWREREP